MSKNNCSSLRLNVSSAQWNKVLVLPHSFSLKLLMDTENLPPNAEPSQVSSKRASASLDPPLFHGKYVDRKRGQGKERTLEKKLAPSSSRKPHSLFPQSSRRRALGDITNKDLTGGQKLTSQFVACDAATAAGVNRSVEVGSGNSRVAGQKDSHIAGEYRLAEALGSDIVASSLDIYDCLVPRDESGNVADIEPLPAGLYSRKLPEYEPPEVDLDGSVTSDREGQSHMIRSSRSLYMDTNVLDELPSCLEKESLPFDAESQYGTESWELLFGENEECSPRFSEKLVDIFPSLYIAEPEENI